MFLKFNEPSRILLNATTPYLAAAAAARPSIIASIDGGGAGSPAAAARRRPALRESPPGQAVSQPQKAVKTQGDGSVFATNSKGFAMKGQGPGRTCAAGRAPAAIARRRLLPAAAAAAAAAAGHAAGSRALRRRQIKPVHNIRA